MKNIVIDFSLLGNGGNGAVAFHREKFVPNGPPSGGNGGHGGHVYIRCVDNLNSLVGITKRIRGDPGGHGMGTWRGGKNAPDTIISVPVGTIVREVLDNRRAQNEFEAEEEILEGLTDEERQKKLRELRWVHYPAWEGSNVESEFFKEAEEGLLKEEQAASRARARQKRDRLANSAEYQGLYLDLTSPTPASDPKGVLVASGGAGGFGNPHFLTMVNRSPKFATRGKPGARITLEFELKLLADIGLVGFPNAGKSTVLRALTRSQAEVAPYAFTTLNPQIGTVRMWEDGRYGDKQSAEDLETRRVIEDSVVERERLAEELESNIALNLPRHNHHKPASGKHRLRGEAMRFTIADNPGLIEGASDNVGLGHSFLRSIERSLALVYVVDLSAEAPWDQLRTLKAELEAHKPGLSRKVRMVLANKADLLNAADEEQVQEAKAKLMKLEAFVKEMEDNDQATLENSTLVEEDSSSPDASPTLGETETRTPIDVVPISGKYQMNLEVAVEKMAAYVKAARLAASSTK